PRRPGRPRRSRPPGPPGRPAPSRRPRGRRSGSRGPSWLGVLPFWHSVRSCRCGTSSSGAHPWQVLSVVAERVRGTGIGTGPWSGRLSPCVAEGGEGRSEEHTSELQSRENLVCRLLLVRKKTGLAAWVILGVVVVRTR